MKKILFILISAAAVFAACSRTERLSDLNGDDLRVRFTSSVGTYTVKGGDAGFDNGDAISIAAGNPINVVNAKYIYRDGVFVPEEEGISWIPNQKTPSLFYAVYPYRENFKFNSDGSFGDSEEYPSGMLVTVEPDQSTYAGYSASNQLACAVEAAPGNDVHLAFYHTVCKVVIKVDNKLSVPVTEVYLSGVYGQYLRYASVVLGNAGTIKANPDGENQWKLVVVPQGNVRPTIVVKTADGAEYAFDCPEGALYFNQGYQVTLSVVLDEKTSQTFTSEVGNWSPDREYVFNNETYMRKKALESLFNEVCGDYEATSSTEAYANPWTMTLVRAGNRIGFLNIFSGTSAWATEDTMFYGDINDDLTGIDIPFEQQAEFQYQGVPLMLYGVDEAFENLYSTPGVTATFVRDETGVITGLDFEGEYGLIAYINGAGYVGYWLPHVTAVKK